MDDIHLEDPRKFSAKQIKVTVERAKKHRSFWQYMFDLIVKTFILASVISIDFTLFANAGNYRLFSSSMWLNMEAQYIYIAIFGLSFVLMFVASFFKTFENVLLALVFALACVVLINQFATFEKQSVLLVLFNGIFSDDINLILYEYAFWIVGIVVFLLSWMLLNVMRRQFMLYFMLGLATLVGWLLSEAYLGGSVQYFRTVATLPTAKGNTHGKNLVFLSFESLTSLNNLRSMYNSTKQYANIQETFQNALGFYSRNNFILYPNAMVRDINNPFNNLIASYNPDTNKPVTSYITTTAVRTDYFDFAHLQTDKMFLKDSSLYDMLRKDGYAINVYQTRGLDTCYLNSKLVATSCKEKVNMPIALDGNEFSSVQKTIMLVGQWLNSTGMVTSINSVLKMFEYIYPTPMIAPLGFEVDKLYVMNSFKVFDQIIDSIDKRSGNNAYFAIIDLPSETYLYDELCKIKDIDDWSAERALAFVKNPVDKRRGAYADQVSCLYGHLEKFVEQLNDAGYLENTTIVIEGLNNPLGLNKNERDYYRKVQENNQVALAIRPADSTKAKIDYSVCYVNDILNSYFFTHESCKEFEGIKTTDKNMTLMKTQIEQDKYKKYEIAAAQQSFDKWFDAWSARNQFKRNVKLQKKSDGGSVEEKVETEVVKKVAVTPAMIKDVPEVKMKSIGAVNEKTDVETVERQVEPVVEGNVVLDIDVEDITNAEVKPVSDIEVQQEDVVPETLNDETEENKQQVSQTDEAISRAKKRIAEKYEQDNLAAQKTIDEVVSEVDSIVDDTMRNVLEAPINEGEKLSPEELKKQYREALKSVRADSEASNIDIKVKVIEK